MLCFLLEPQPNSAKASFCPLACSLPVSQVVQRYLRDRKMTTLATYKTLMKARYSNEARGKSQVPKNFAASLMDAGCRNLCRTLTSTNHPQGYFSLYFFLFIK